MSHDIDVLIASCRTTGDVVLPDGWGQGRATFGGVVAGALVARTLGELELPDALLRSVTINFVAPAEPGAAEISVEVLRAGKSATQVEARLIQASETGESTVRAIALLTFGAERSSSVALLAEGAGNRPDFAQLPRIPSIPGVTPDFIDHVDLRPATGAYPFSGASAGDLTGYMRFGELTARFDLPHLVTLIDAWPPAAGQMLSAPAPMSTMTWTLEFLAAIDATPETAWWYDVVTDSAGHGYAHSGARIFDEQGRLVVISRQTVALFG